MPEDNPSRLARLRTRFSLLDANGDGRLQAEDFDLLAGRVLDALAVKRNSVKATALLEGCRIYWQGLVAASGGEGHGEVVSFEEYAAVIPDDDHFDHYGQPYVSALADLADWNEDGQVERADFLACMAAIGFAEPQVERIYAEMSFDGAVAAEDWKAAIRDFYVSAAANTPGQLLVRRSA
ncbi:EF-hand domain-containing protein [Nonomuraea insulae]|uniref:EF-hand domain-containing protein n=1 Tax=Nonomuraea insulae TaxID=1616787 RepID=A0ABW1CVD4_9ACTN